jgi:hypothetical protein
MFMQLNVPFLYKAQMTKNLQRQSEYKRRIASSGMLRGVALVRTDVSDERIASIIRVTRIGGLGTLAVTNNRRTLRAYVGC